MKTAYRLSDVCSREGDEMTKDDIISIAREAGWKYADGDDGYAPLWKFGELVAAAERKACAALCKEVAAGRDAEAIEEAILARGKK